MDQHLDLTAFLLKVNYFRYSWTVKWKQTIVHNGVFDLIYILGWFWETFKIKIDTILKPFFKSLNFFLNQRIHSTFFIDLFIPCPYIIGFYVNNIQTLRASEQRLNNIHITVLGKVIFDTGIISCCSAWSRPQFQNQSFGPKQKTKLTVDPPLQPTHQPKPLAGF